MRVILITGASSGLGQALALEYAAPDATIILLARRVERLKETSESILRRGGTPILYEADVRNGELLERVAREILCRFGVPDLIIANAGIRGGRQGNDRETMESLFRTNVMGVMNTVLPFLPSLRSSGKGQIAIIGSLASYRGLPDAGGYCASKAAIQAWSDSLRFETEPCGISVSLINPGFVRTEMTRDNPYPMPFILTADEAAKRIRRGLAGKKALIEFPFPLVLAVRLLALLPPRSSDRIFRSFSSRSAR